MKEEILRQLQNAEKLEELYRKDKSTFRKIFLEALAEIPQGSVRDFWLARLNADKSEVLSWGRPKDWYLVLFAALAGGLVLKLPVFFHLKEDNFFPRNLVFAFAPGLMVFLSKRSKTKDWFFYYSLIFMGMLALYIDLLPGPPETRDSIWLACLHMPVLIWLLLARLDAGDAIQNTKETGGFIRFSAELLVMCGLVMAAGGLFTAILLGLFQAIGIPIHKIYFEWFGVFGAAGIPLLATLVLKENPELLKQVAPVVAGIFTPLALLALLIFLPALLLSGRNLFSDREFLLVFNVLLLGVLALIFFSLPEIEQHPQKRAGLLVLTGLSMLCLLVNSIALSAIVYRVFSFGITANRAAVLGSNLLILTNLFLVCRQLILSLKSPERPEEASRRIGQFLPIYGIWAFLVIFFFPLLFGFR